MSTLLFSVEKNDKDLKFELLFEPYVTRKNNFLDFDIYVNNSLNKKIKLDLKKNSKEERKIEILIKTEEIVDKEVKIDFNFKNPVSPMEVFKSPDSRKLGILLKNIKINSI